MAVNIFCKCGQQLNDKKNNTYNTIKTVKGEEIPLCINCFEKEVDRACEIYRHLIAE
jgi:hypothetical protein|tara:strand:- start:1864 stop:2034 length:171 start_codon:yes stop_codon:yes gene_type:complete